MVKRTRRWMRRAYVRLLRAPGAPNHVALGMAIGLFVAMLPLLGVQMPVALAVVEVVRRITGIHASRLAAAIGAWITNPVTAAPIYALCVLIGRPFAPVVLGAWGTVEPTRMGVTADGARELVVSMTIGGMLLGIPVALLGYFLTRRAIVGYQARRAARGRARRARSVVLAQPTTSV